MVRIIHYLLHSAPHLLLSCVEKMLVIFVEPQLGRIMHSVGSLFAVVFGMREGYEGHTNSCMCVHFSPSTPIRQEDSGSSWVKAGHSSSSLSSFPPPHIGMCVCCACTSTLFSYVHHTLHITNYAGMEFIRGEVESGFYPSLHIVSGGSGMC
jgi:hypothetical protein